MTQNKLDLVHFEILMINFNQKNLFVESALTAFKDHYPLKIKPDIIWITILQGFARHIDKNAEKFRGKFVAHEGKKEITIVRNGFVKGGQNDWPNCFPEFSDKIEENLVDPEIRQLVECIGLRGEDTRQKMKQKRFRPLWVEILP